MLSKLLKKKEMGIFLIIAGITIIVSIVNILFIRPDNILTMFVASIVLGIAAQGMMMIMITGGIDVSIGATIAMCYVTAGLVSKQFPENGLFITIVATCAVGVLCGLVNGTLVSKLKIPPIVVTLGTMSLYNGLVLLITNGKWIADLPPYIAMLGQQYLFKVPMEEGGFWGFPMVGFFWVGAIILTSFVMNRTLIGRGIYAIGGNMESASRIGYKTNRILMFVYAYTGFLAGLSAIVHTGIMRQVDPLAFRGFELKVIAAVVVGGTNVMGGYGSVFGTVLGVVFMAVINNALVIMHIPTFYQKIVLGIVIVTAVSIDVIQHTIKTRNMVKVDVSEA